MPSYPITGPARLFGLLDGLPRWVRPPVWGALIATAHVAVLSAIRGLDLTELRNWESFATMFAWAAAAGVVGAFAYSLAKPFAKRFPHLKKYVMGSIVIVTCVMAALLVMLSRGGLEPDLRIIGGMMAASMLLVVMIGLAIAYGLTDVDDDD